MAILGKSLLMQLLDRNVLAIAFSCAPVALIAWLAQSRLVFLGGLAGAVGGLWLVPGFVICEITLHGVPFEWEVAKTKIHTTLPSAVMCALAVWAFVAVWRVLRPDVNTMPSGEKLPPKEPIDSE